MLNSDETPAENPAGRRRRMPFLAFVLVVGTGFILLFQNTGKAEIQIDLKDHPECLIRTDAEVMHLPEGSLVHRASFYFSRGDITGSVRAQARLHRNERYSAYVAFFCPGGELKQGNSKEAAPRVFSYTTEFTYSGESPVRLSPPPSAAPQLQISAAPAEESGGSNLEKAPN